MKSRNPFNLRRRLHRVMCSRRLCACDLRIMGMFILLAMCFSCETPEMSASPETLTAADTFKAPPRRAPLTTPPAFDAEAYYSTIINNNLFRPLGWTPPRPVAPYRLLGTILPTDEKTPPQAIIQVSTAGNKTHIISIGDTLDADTKVVDIQPKQVTLDRAGQQTTLKLDTSPWISTAKGRFSRRG